MYTAGRRLCSSATAPHSACRAAPRRPSSQPARALVRTLVPPSHLRWNPGGGGEKTGGLTA
jgi:hypothetical protein